jgi:hypothetical protein
MKPIKQKYPSPFSPLGEKGEGRVRDEGRMNDEVRMRDNGHCPTHS